MVIDAFIESSTDGIRWQRSRPDLTTEGPWAIPHAVELARRMWAQFVHALDAYKKRPAVRVRVIDTNGVVVEQWPKEAQPKASCGK